MKLSRKFKILSLAAIVGAVSFPQISSACSVAFWNNNKEAKVVARSMDLYISDEPTIFVYPRGIERKGNAGENSAQWKSKYGSVVITAFHQDASSDGMNEQGLTGHLLYLEGTEYEKRDVSKPVITNALWLQYALDQYKTVPEAIEGLRKIQVMSAKIGGKEWPIHLALEDVQGDSAIFEFIHGKLVLHQGAQYNVMTNEPAFEIQLANLKKYKLFGGKLAMPGEGWDGKHVGDPKARGNLLQKQTFVIKGLNIQLRQNNSLSNNGVR